MNIYMIMMAFWLAFCLIATVGSIEPVNSGHLPPILPPHLAARNGRTAVYVSARRIGGVSA